jgi:transglutaminase-like putative cysteine protease
MKAYLLSTDIIDWEHPDVLAKAKQLTNHLKEDTAVAKACFEFVRDEIAHSMDFKRNPVTCKASDVLKYGTGYCYAKSHLLAALLRANGIPAGLCYQRLSINDETPPFCLHGLNAVFLEDFGWYRIDARGNKPGVNAQFCPPDEQLAFPIQVAGEMDLPEIYADPLPQVVEALTTYQTYLEVAAHLPDIDPEKLD